MAKRNLVVDTKEAMDTAKEIYKGVAAKWGIQQPPVFFASKGWYDRFLGRRKIKNKDFIRSCTFWYPEVDTYTKCLKTDNKTKPNKTFTFAC